MNQIIPPSSGTPLVFVPLTPPLPHTHVDSASTLGLHKGRDVICLNHVSFAYDGRPAVTDVTLHVPSGSTLGIIGPNGGGKSTLLKLMLGVLLPQQGTISILDRSPREACADGTLVGYVPQRHSLDWSFPIVVRQVVQLGLIGRKKRFRRFAREDRALVDQALAAVDMLDFADRSIGGLSGGQQQRVFIARALVAKPQLLFLDEPTTGIDQAGQEKFVGLLDGLKRQYGLTLVIVSHDLRSVVASCDHVACLSRTLHYHDRPGGLSREVLFKVFQCDLDAVLEQHVPAADGSCCPPSKCDCPPL
ncbi:MAG: ABC transporter ATP-binding protein [Phycisphaerae bacterium]